jgi:uncharacterized protein YciI
VTATPDPLARDQMQMHAVLEYAYGDDYLSAREAHRSAHLKVAWAAVERGELVLGGAVGDGPFTALLVFAGPDALENARAFAAVDPYVTERVVTSWTARPWRTVVGTDAASPAHP